MKETLSWVYDTGMVNVIVESNLKVLVSAVSSNRVDNSDEFGLIVQFCKFKLLQLLNIFVRFVRRQANEATHLIAKAAHSYARYFVWSEIPHFVQSHISKDKMYCCFLINAIFCFIRK